MFYPYGGSKGNARLIQRQPPAYTLIWEVPCLLNLRFPHLCNQQVLINLKLESSFFVAATCYNRSFLQFVSSHGLGFPWVSLVCGSAARRGQTTATCCWIRRWMQVEQQFPYFQRLFSQTLHPECNCTSDGELGEAGTGLPEWLQFSWRLKMGIPYKFANFNGPNGDEPGDLGVSDRRL